MNQTPTESQEQIALFEWAERRKGMWPELRLMYHIPNEGKRDPRVANRMKREGLKKGVPDVCLPVPRGGYNGLYIELKRRKGSHTTQAQKDWLASLELQGYKAVMCRGWAQAAEEIEAYMGGGTK